MLKMLSELGQKRFVVVAGTQTKQEAHELLNSRLAQQRIDSRKLDLIAGRNVYYGMQSVSKRTPYFFTFLREPIERFISQYSYLAKCAADPRNKTYEMACQRVVVDNKIISIREFVERQQARNLMTIALAAASSAEETADSWWQVNPQSAPQKAKWMLEQMSFIGFVEQFEDDSKYMFDQLKLNPQQRRSNVSASQTVQVDSDTMKLIQQANELDLEIYEYAQRLAKGNNSR